jgi:IS4 transposase
LPGDTYKGDSKLPIRLRRLVVKRDTGDTITLLTNDLERSAAEIAALYKGRWQIELLFRWIKQHLKIRKFLGNTDNAIRLQLFAAMITYALLRIAARAHRIALPILRFTDLVVRCLFERRNIVAIERPPPVNPGRAEPFCSPAPPGSSGSACAVRSPAGRVRRLLSSSKGS